MPWQARSFCLHQAHRIAWNFRCSSSCEHQNQVNTVVLFRTSQDEILTWYWNLWFWKGLPPASNQATIETIKKKYCGLKLGTSNALVSLYNSNLHNSHNGLARNTCLWFPLGLLLWLRYLSPAEGNQCQLTAVSISGFRTNPQAEVKAKQNIWTGWNCFLERLRAAVELTGEESENSERSLRVSVLPPAFSGDSGWFELAPSFD